MLRRSITNRKVKGVAAGIATAADIPTGAVRALFVIAALSGWGIVAYIALAIVLHDETAEAPCVSWRADQRVIARVGLGVAALIAVGRLVDGHIGLPVLLVVCGVLVLWSRRAAAMGGRGRVDDGAGFDGRADRPGVDDPFDWSPTPRAGRSSSWDEPTGWPIGASRRSDRVDWHSTATDVLRVVAAFIVVGAIVVTITSGVLVAVGAVHIRRPAIPAALAAVGIVLSIIAVIRRTRVGALLVGLGTIGLALVTAIALLSSDVGAGVRTVVIDAANPLRERYEFGAGRMTVDFSGVSLSPGTTRSVSLRQAAGRLVITVPPADKVHTVVTAHVGSGVAEVLGSVQRGFGVEAASPAAPAPEGAPTLRLDVELGFGSLAVVRMGSVLTPATLEGPVTFAPTSTVPAPGAAGNLTCPFAPVGTPRTCTLSTPAPRPTNLPSTTTSAAPASAVSVTCTHQPDGSDICTPA